MAPEHNIQARLRDLSIQTEKASSSLKQRLISLDRAKASTTAPRRPPPLPSARHTTHPVQTTPLPPHAPRIDLSGGRRSQTPQPPTVSQTPPPPPAVPCATLSPAPVTPTATPPPLPRWAQQQRIASSQASAELKKRIPSALSAMAMVASPPPLSIVPLLHSLRNLTKLMVAFYLCAIGILIGVFILSGIGIKPSVPRAVGAVIAPLILCIVVHLTWFYRIWQILPPNQLVTDKGVHISPMAALGRYFVPFYNIHWLFESQTILCNALDYASTEAGSTKKAPRALGTLCAWVALIPGINLVLGPLFDFDFMTRVTAILQGIRDANTG